MQHLNVNRNDDKQNLSIAATTIVMLGKLFIAGSFAVIYNYSAELFPTGNSADNFRIRQFCSLRFLMFPVVRNSAMGLGSMCARLSGALTPLITLLGIFISKFF